MAQAKEISSIHRWRGIYFSNAISEIYLPKRL